MRHGGLARAFVVVVFGFSALPLACGSTQEAVPEETTGESQQALGLCQVAPGTYIQCPGSSACCNNVCVDLATSNSNCGACGATCGRPNVCGGGHCCTYGTSWCATEGACIAPCDCPPDLASWLTAHPNVAAELKWQPTATASETNGYEVAPGDKQAYASWPVARKLALALAFNARYSALCKGQRFFETLPDPLPNAASNIANDGNSPATHIDAASAEALYIAQVAHSLAVELGNFVPWSVSAYDSQSLAVLFDSSSMMRLLDSVPPIYSLGGWYSGYVASKREHNQGRSLPAPPSVGYAFMKRGLLGATRHASIVNTMQWAHDNMIHFFGSATFLNMEQTWGYRGHAPASFVIGGTTSTSSAKPANTPAFQHWTAGCHGTAGFFRDVLRTVNIPVQVPGVCGHSQIYFRTEGLYVDHADNLYSGYGAFPVDMEYLLVDQPTYTSWFGDNLSNEAWSETPPNPHCANVGRRLVEQIP